MFVTDKLYRLIKIIDSSYEEMGSYYYISYIIFLVSTN